MTEARHPIKMVARLTGLSPYVLRIWEQRYGAVEPQRTATNRRLYSSQDVERLSLLREVTQAGYNIGQVATLPADKLRQLAAASGVVPARDHPSHKGGAHLPRTVFSTPASPPCGRSMRAPSRRH